MYMYMCKFMYVIMHISTYVLCMYVCVYLHVNQTLTTEWCSAFAIVTAPTDTAACVCVQTKKQTILNNHCCQDWACIYREFTCFIPARSYCHMIYFSLCVCCHMLMFHSSWAESSVFRLDFMFVINTSTAQPNPEQNTRSMPLNPRNICNEDCIVCLHELL